MGNGEVIQYYLFISVVEDSLAVDVQARLNICCSYLYQNLITYLKSLSNETMQVDKKAEFKDIYFPYTVSVNRINEYCKFGNFASILFSRIALNDIFARLKIRY